MHPHTRYSNRLFVDNCRRYVLQSVARVTMEDSEGAARSMLSQLYSRILVERVDTCVDLVGALPAVEVVE